MKIKRAIRKAMNDKKQYVLDAKRETAIKPRDAGITREMTFKTQVYFCPFCLFFGKLSDFEFKTLKGKISKRMRCPDCDNLMLMRTLIQKMTAEEYAEWVFWYSKSGFWSKCNFDKWSERLYKLGMLQRFWTKYKLLKGESVGQETYFEHLDKEQEEWAKEKGYAE